MIYEKSKTRTKRRMIFDEVRRQLKAEGYPDMGMIFIDRYMKYRLITVAVAHLASVLHRDPHRVYQALLCRAEWTAKGRHFCDYKQAQPPQDGQLGGGGDGISVFCPVCGCDLVEQGKMTKEEISRTIHRNSVKRAGKCTLFMYVIRPKLCLP